MGGFSAMGNTVDIKAAKEFSLVDNMSLWVVISSVKQHKKITDKALTITFQQSIYHKNSFSKMKIKNHKSCQKIWRTIRIKHKIDLDLDPHVHCWPF